MSIDVALLLDEPSLQKWQRQAIFHLLHKSEVDTNLSLVVINEGGNSTSLVEQIITFLRNFSLWNCFVALRIIKAGIGDSPWYRTRVSLNDSLDLADVTICSCKPEPVNHTGNGLPDEIVAELSNVDVAIRFGFGILRGEALTAPKYGILSYHHGDLSEYRGRPAGFYEFIHRRATVGVTVQQLSENLDKGTIVVTDHCEIGNAESLGDVHSKQFAASPPLLAEAINRLANDQLPKQPDTFGPLYTKPDAQYVILYLWYRFYTSLRKYVPNFTVIKS